MDNQVTKNWGSYRVQHFDCHSLVKRIWMKPNSTMSQQIHRHRDEIVIVERGRLTVILGSKVYNLEEGHQFTVPRGILHCYLNTTGENLIFTEIWISKDGTLKESDIERR